ncbi:MAG: PepSY domain-containing protein [Sideroxyarcus sp.]|nr:PepSY domain-containing protein [Sideroxyarcus sp.]
MTNKAQSIYRPLLAMFLILGLSVSGTGHAGDPGDHDRARHALEAGEILPLRTILENMERDYPGQIMEVELDRKAGGWIYEIKLLRKGGELVKLKVDARDGKVVDIKRKEDKSRLPGDTR